MVGGVVIETIPCVVRGEARVWINVRGTKCDRHRTLAIYVADSYAARSVSVGDSIWWHGSRAMWTPKSRPFHDYELRRIGFSGVARPGEAVAS